jgi:hypothetical protein
MTSLLKPLLGARGRSSPHLVPQHCPSRTCRALVTWALEGAARAPAQCPPGAPRGCSSPCLVQASRAAPSFRDGLCTPCAARLPRASFFLRRPLHASRCTPPAPLLLSATASARLALHSCCPCPPTTLPQLHWLPASTPTDKLSFFHILRAASSLGCVGCLPPCGVVFAFQCPSQPAGCHVRPSGCYSILAGALNHVGRSSFSRWLPILRGADLHGYRDRVLAARGLPRVPPKPSGVSFPMCFQPGRPPLLPRLGLSSAPWCGSGHCTR